MSRPSPKIRVGLLLAGNHVAAWVARMVEQVQASDHSEIVLLVVDESPPPASAGNLFARLRQEPASTLRQIVRRLLEAAIERLVQVPPQLPDAFSSWDLASMLAHVPRVAVTPRRTQWSDHFEDADVAAVRDHDVDVLIRVGFRILRGDILRAARVGVWSFHHGDNDVNRGGPPGYWESLERWPVTGCTLQILNEDLDNGLVLAKTWSSTVGASVADNNRSTYWKSLSLIPRQLRELHRLGAERFLAEARAAQPHPRWYSSRLYRPPGNRDLLRLLLRRLVERVRCTVAARLSFDQWILLVHANEGLSMSLWRYKRLLPPKDRFWADPFLLTHLGRHYLYFEELLYATRRGHIAVAEILPDGRMLAPQPALVAEHHLSYPFVFEHEGEVYMVPESRGGRCVPLYRCVEMPHRWEKVKNLMTDVDAVDATLCQHGGRWWMFVSLVENRGGSSCDELFVFHANSPLSDKWVAHPLNPVVSDARRARPAGRLFTHEGRLYRPSQDCSHRYGWGLNLNWVEVLTPEDYRERRVSHAAPDWAPDLMGTHTFNREGRLHVIDAEIRRSRWR